ncbi:MAG: alpha/beta hydrolase, partial [Oscillatoriales cyanobacterium SM2_2_1]|nr:alpha/beta hydrolase [Oscillatoriales cyanobacterium SM2_2_1]
MPLPSIILPGYLAGSADYQPMAQLLDHLGFPATVVPLQWWEWLPTVGGRSIAPILEKLDQAIAQLQHQYQAKQVNIIAHSAGGWISRIYLGDRPYYQKIWHGRPKVARLISLGPPHRSLEPWTTNNLGFVNEQYPQAYYPDITYI